ncbi:MAG: hypothetical protein ACE5I3_03115 [Phycisphaerae bacterium]
MKRLRGIVMRCSLVGVFVGLLLSSPAAWGQSSGGDGNDNETIGANLAERSPAENVRGGAVWERAPGRIVDLARARHLALRDQRAVAQRTGDTSMLAPQPDAVGGLGGSLSNLFGDGSLAGLISSFLNSGLAGALGGPMGGSLQPAGNRAGAGTTTGADSGAIDFSNLPPEVIQMLAGAGIDLNDLNQRSREDAPAAADAQAKALARAQANNGQEQPKFIVRWADAMLSTFFTSLTVGFQTQDFIDLLKDLFRPLFIPQEAGADEADGTASDGGNNGSQDTGDGGQSDDGGGDGDAGGII